VARERFRRAALGYDPEQVDAAIASRDARLERLEREAQRLAQRVVDRERRLHETMKRFGDEGIPGTIGAVTKSLEDIYGQARRQATRIRMKALDDAVQMAEKVMEMANLRDDLGARVTELAGMAGIDLNKYRPAGATQPAPADGRYAGRVEVEVGPLRDFAQLTGFEDAAAAIEHASQIQVKRFTGGRAIVSMNLDGPVELLRELEERAPFEFKVRVTRHDGLVLDVDDDGGSPG
jgi:hypothetical protein